MSTFKKGEYPELSDNSHQVDFKDYDSQRVTLFDKEIKSLAEQQLIKS
jgi:hypothetical protein